MQRLSGDLKMPFQLDRELYRKDDTAVHEALREAVVNALVHADHRGQGGVVIERYPDRIELSNPGSLLVSRVQLLQGGVSECRNKSLQLMFQLMGGGDKAGSGMDKIRAGWRAQHWRSPRLEESLQPDRVKLVLPMVSLIPDEVDRALRQRFGDRFAKLDTTAVQAVVTAQVEGSVTNARMQEITGEHSKDITGVLQTLVRDGLLTQQNQRRWASYRVSGDSPHLGGDSRHLEGDSPQSSPQLPGDSPHLDGDSPHLDGDSPHLTGDSPHLSSELLSLAEPARRRAKLPTAEMQTLVLHLCENRWLTARELADLLSRDTDNLQSRILTGLVKKGLLELRHPGVPNRPDQAYRTSGQ
jgi:ATP-dependent DNA helicase RecG